MANFKITATTTVAELKEQFHNEFGGILRVYEGRSEAPEDATLVSLGGKVGELECRASRTVGKFEEAFQEELGLKVKVYTKDNWVTVLDGITLATVREIPKSATKAKMEQFLAYQRDDKEEDNAELKNISHKESCDSDLSYKFEDSYEEELDLSNWDTSNVVNMKGMFAGCGELKKLNVRGWDTSNVTDMLFMFDGCECLEELDLGCFDTANVRNMSSMFAGCSSLESLDLSSFDTKKVNYLSSMFSRCTGLKELNLSGWDIKANTAYKRMFHNCEELEKIVINGCDTTTVKILKEALSECGLSEDILVGTSIEDADCSLSSFDGDIHTGWDKSVEKAKETHGVALPLHKLGDNFNNDNEIKEFASDSTLFFATDGKGNFRGFLYQEWSEIEGWLNDNPNYTEMYYNEDDLYMDAEIEERYNDDNDWPSSDRCMAEAVIEQINNEPEYVYPYAIIELIYNGEIIHSYSL